MTRVDYDTAQKSARAVFTDNQTGNNMEIERNNANEHIGLYADNGSKNVKLVHDSQGVNIKGHAYETQIGDTRVTNVNANLRDQTASGTLHHDDGSKTSLNSNSSNTTVTRQDGDSYSQVKAGRDGSLNAKGSIYRDADPTKEGVTMTRVDYDTAQKSARTVLTDNQTGNNMEIERNNANEHVGLYADNGSKNVKLVNNTQGLNAKGHAYETQIGDTRVTNVNANLRDQTASGTLHHDDGSKTSLNSNSSNTTVTRQDGDSYSQVKVGRDGKVGLQGRISKMADPEKEGVTVTRVDYNTAQRSAKAVITDNQTGRTVSVAPDRNGIKISTGGNGKTDATISFDRNGINIQGKGGKKINVSKIASFIKGFSR